MKRMPIFHFAFFCENAPSFYPARLIRTIPNRPFFLYCFSRTFLPNQKFVQKPFSRSFAVQTENKYTLSHSFLKPLLKSVMKGKNYYSCDEPHSRLPEPAPHRRTSPKIRCEATGSYGSGGSGILFGRYPENKKQICCREKSKKMRKLIAVRSFSTSVFRCKNPAGHENRSGPSP